MGRYAVFRDFFTAIPLLGIVDNEENRKNNSKDFFLFGPPPESRRYRANTDPNDLSLPKSLGVRIAATHAGRVTLNNGLYLPDKMKAGTSTWTSPYPKPILLHHNAEDDGIGRVREAKYIDISTGFRRESSDHLRSKFSDSEIKSDAILDAFIEGKLPIEKAIDVARELFLKDYSLTKDDSYEGLGYIELIASITDPDSIKKIITDRFLTGSIGARSDAAICSVCKKDWIKEEQCDHNPGHIYDGVLCVVIAGNLQYKEWSYVNQPADTLSRTLEIFQDGEMKDSINLIPKSDKVPEICLNIEDSLTEFSNNREDIERMEFTLESAIQLIKDKRGELYKAPESKFFDVKFTMELTEEAAKELATATFVKDITQEDFLGKVKEKINEVTSLLQEGLSDEDRFYEEVVAIVKSGQSDMTKEEVQLFLDAKLSSAQRKQLSSSTFCGPERSFPVPDCSHYSAALRLLGKYKGSGDKGKIKACIERKGTRLGCNSKKESVEKDCGQFCPDWFDQYEDQELIQLRVGLDKVMEERKVDFSSACEDSLSAKIVELEQKLAKVPSDAEKELLTTELTRVHQEMEELKNQLINETSASRKILIDNIVFLTLLKGSKPENEEQFRKDLMEKPVAELSDSVKSLQTELDVGQVIDTIKIGLARNPREVKIVNPVIGFIEEDAEGNTRIKITKEEMEQIKEKYEEIRWMEGQARAEYFLADLKAKGILPEEIPSEDK